MLERERELEALDAALTAARDARGALVVAVGAAGIGKSALIGHALERAPVHGLRAISARGAELEQPLAFGAVRQLLEPVLHTATPDDRRRLTDGPAALVPPLFERAPRPHDEELELHHALFWLVANLAEDRPLLVAVDDLHWLDTSSLRFLLYLGQRLEELPIAVVASIRSGEPGADEELLARLLHLPAASELRPAPLTAAASRELVARRLPDAAPELADALFRASGGNPLYLGELLRALETEGVGTGAEAARRVEDLAPDSVARATLLRFAGLPPGSRQLARAVALLGEDALLARAATLAGLDVTQAAAAADALCAIEVLVPGEPLRFAHPLLRATLEADIPAAERALARAAAARLLDADGVTVERVANQLLGAPRRADPWAVDRLQAAAASARAQAAAGSAVRYLRRALEEPPPREQLPYVLAALSEASALTGDLGAIDHAQRAVELLPDPDERARALGRLGHLLYEAGRMAEAHAAFERGVRERPGADDALAVELSTAATGVASLLGRISLEELERRADAATEVADGAGRRARRELATELALAHVFSSRSATDAASHARRALDGGAMLAEDGVSLSFSMAVSCLTWADELAEADRAIDAALELARRSASPATAAYVLFGRAQVRYWEGRVSEAAADAGAAVEAWRGGFGMHLPSAAHWHALALIELGEPEEAAAAVALAEGEAATELSEVQAAYARLRLGLARGDGPAADAAGRALERRARGSTFFQGPATLPWRSLAALAALRAGDERRARALADEELELARRFGAARTVGVALHAAGLVRGGGEGIELTREAVRTLERSPSRLALAHALLGLGTLLRSRGERVKARDPLRRALDLARALGLADLRARARAELEAAGARPRREALSGFEALTPSERRVAELAAAGRSNPEIAQELFVTRKTVEFHLRGAYRKLGISSRQELPAALAGR